MSESRYTPVPLDNLAANLQEIQSVSNDLDAAERILLKRASRWVLFLCFLQTVMTIPAFFAGHFFYVLFSLIFITMGLVGLKRQGVKLMTAHLVYSIIIYIFSLIGVVLTVLYCDQDHSWWVYIIGFFMILFQAIGMKHSKRMILLLKKRELGSKLNHCVLQEIKVMAENVPPQTQNVAMYPIPNQQFMAMQMQPDQQIPTYFPMVVPYPMMPQMMNEEATQSQTQQPGLYPVNYQF